MKFSRAWGMPSADTFECKPIRDFVGRYMSINKVSVDPFARNRTEFTYTNDLNPNTAARHHMDAEKYLAMLHDARVKADILILDPPYSPRQVKECYDSFGLEMKQEDALLGLTRKRLKTQAIKLLVPG